VRGFPENFRSPILRNLQETLEIEGESSTLWGSEAPKRKYRLILVVIRSSVILAAVVSSGIVMKMAMPLRRRIGLTAAILCLLALEWTMAGF